MKKQAWYRGYAYIDAFAGAGVHISRRMGDFDPPFPGVPFVFHLILNDMESITEDKSCLRN